MKTASAKFGPAGTAAAQAEAGKAASDRDLISRIAGGDRHAMGTLFSRERVRVYRFLRRMIRDGALAEDLVSDVFMDVWRQAGHFEARSSLSTWLLGIARNKALSALRRKGFDELDEEVVSLVPDTADTPQSSLEKKDVARILRRCLANLPRSHAEIMDLVYYHEKSVGEVAKLMGIPENTVKTRMFAARKRLAGLLGAASVDRTTTALWAATA
jgi:RNA polymerase sigma-70 factor (ECF subfamily)